MDRFVVFLFFFFFNDTATPEIYTLSLHDALPIYGVWRHSRVGDCRRPSACVARDRKSTRLNSSHRCISYAVFCLKKKKDACATSRFQALPDSVLHALKDGRLS